MSYEKNHFWCNRHIRLCSIVLLIAYRLQQNVLRKTQTVGLKRFCARQQNASRVLAMPWRLSVRPSHSEIVSKRRKLHRITKSSLWTALRTLVVCDEISCPWVRSFFSNEGVKGGTHLKSTYFTAIGSSSVKTAADMHRHAVYHNRHWWRSFQCY